MEKYDIVDVHLSSTKSMLDSILEHPILDGDKTYTIAVTEFTAPISAETPLPLNQTFKDQEPTMYLLNVKRKNGDADTVISHISHSMSTLPAPLGQAAGILNQFQRFMPNVYKSIQTVNDLVFYIQEYFTEIQKVYATAGGPGIDGGEHGGGANVTAANVGADQWVRASLTPNGRIRLVMSEMFASNFFIQLSDFSQSLFGFDEEVIAFGTHGGAVTSGIPGLVGDGNTLLDSVQNLNPGETCIIEGKYPLTRFFDHRVMIDVDSGGMPIPNVVTWNTSNQQSLRHTLATFPINQRMETGIHLNNVGGATGEVDFRSELMQGNIVWRRAEDKIRERYQILNPQFFQNIRLEIIIERREWDFQSKAYVFKRRAMLFRDGDSWTAKLRFRTLK